MSVWIKDFCAPRNRAQATLTMLNDMFLAKLNLLRLIMEKPIEDCTENEIEIQILLEKDPEIQKLFEGPIQR